MVSSAYPVEIIWEPGLSIGYSGVAISLVMFGVSFGQMLFYLYSFPNDKRWLKLTILTIFFWDSVHTIGLLSAYWHVVLSCRRNTTSPECRRSFSRGSLVAFVGHVLVTLSVQSFYVHRVWIISGKNQLIAGVIILVMFFQKFFAFSCGELVIKNRDWLALFGHPYALLASGSGLMFNALVMISIAYFLRSNRSQMPGRNNYTRQLKRVFMEMGLMTCIIHILVVITLLLPDLKARQRWAFAPGSLLTKSYFNSMLAVLNARKAIRQRQEEALGQMYELGTLRNNS
ncbi:hypothetical protein K503DRAFT_541046 [Rhizopogon vinicolor AM-OR11-026]|uniref:DUF6534 domain-containing protein n=1 Tax=Rhizopogon vinicolor AM-OR11-026 TaxID=1314800 RepID=A0A1B7MKR3_9AGAM|nr:hypothetical protein K503DRAFT_541046 [Rhizopogon vinicolor AM-OR11-026]